MDLGLASRTRYRAPGPTLGLSGFSDIFNYLSLSFALFFIGVYLIYNIMLVSGIQQSDSCMCVFIYIYTHMHRLPGGTMVRNLLTNAGDTCPIPGLGRFPGEGMATHSNILTWTISWREEPGGLQSFGLQELDMTQQMRVCMRTRAHTHTHTCSSDSLFLWVITKY